MQEKTMENVKEIAAEEVEVDKVKKTNGRSKILVNSTAIILIIIAFIMALGKQIVSGFLLLSVGLMMIPDVWAMMMRALKIKIEPALKTVILLVLSFVACACISSSPTLNIEEKENYKEELTTTEIETVKGEQITNEATNGTELITELARVNEASEEAIIKRIIDGDTVELVDGRKLRYIGINTPEVSGTAECLGIEAKNRNQALVENQKVFLEKDISETDRYGRLLRYVYLENGQMVNEILVAEGYAQASTYPPDVKYQERLTGVEKEAREAKAGLWSGVCQSLEAKAETSALKTVAPAATKTEATVDTRTAGAAAITAVETGVTGATMVNNALKATATPISTITNTSGAKTPTNNVNTNSSSNYQCNCSKTCTQMSSCAEAQYQLNVCGCSKRDGDGDGKACDAQCGG